MSNSAQLSASTDTTQIQRIAGNVRGLSEHAQGLANRLETWKARVMGLHNESPVEENAPEPVRSDLEELVHQIEQTQHQLTRIESHLNDVESV